jgi:hypothetical protein
MGRQCLVREWLHGGDAMPAMGDWPGYDCNSNVKKKNTGIGVNMRSHGDALFISSANPEIDS